jgi:signal transduction histidine kinase
MSSRAWLARLTTATVADAALALTLFAAGQAETWLSFGTGLGHGSDVVTAALGAVMTLPLAFRRRYPVVVALLVSIPTPVVGLFTGLHLLFFGGLLPLLVVAYTLAARAVPPRSLALLALPLAMLVAVELEVPEFRKIGEIVFDWLWFAVTIGIGLVVRSRSLHATRSESRAERLETEREAVLREERARIARELHDVIAHNVSMIVVQAGAERRMLNGSDGSTREVLETIERIGRGALTDMRRLLGMLRSDAAESLAPQPRLGDLPRLVARVCEAGLPVELWVDGEQRELPAGIELSAYRIVQEALTNALKHAGDARARVSVRYGADSLELEIADDGAGGGAAGGAGHGLVGMRERVALYGGHLDAQRGRGGGFVVRVKLPVA